MSGITQERVLTRAARPSDAEWFVQLLRPADLLEARTATGGDVRSAIMAGIALGDSWVSAIQTRDGRVLPLGIWGVHPAYGTTAIGPQFGVAWLLTTCVVDTHPVAFY